MAKGKTLENGCEHKAEEGTKDVEALKKELSEIQKKDMENRGKAFTEKYAALCKEYRCQLSVEPAFTVDKDGAMRLQLKQGIQVQP